jgi:hypothetical protein
LVGWQEKKVLSNVPDYSEMLDDWQRRLEAAPKFGPTFEGFDYRTPEYERLAETRDAINRIPSIKDVTPAQVEQTAQQFKDAFIANRQNLQKEFGSAVTPVNELLDRFDAASPGASAILRNNGGAESFRHEIYSHLHPWEANLSPDYRGFQGNTLSYEKSPITPLNEGVAVWTDRGMAAQSPYKNMLPDDPSNIGNYFKDFVSRVAEGDDAYTSSSDKADTWIRQYGAGKDVSEKLANIGGLYREKYIQPATQRFKNLSLAQAPTDDDVAVRFGGATQNFEQKLIKPAEMADTHLKNRANLPEMFTRPFIERNLLFSQDPVTAGIQGVGEMLRSAPRGIAGGAALSALSPDVAQSVEQGQYGKAVTQTAQNVAGGALTDLAIQAAGQGLQRAAPQVAARVIPAFGGVANVAVPAAVGAGLFMQGKQGSPLNTIVNAASNTPFGLKVNPKTDVGRRAGHAIGNEARYALGQFMQGRMPWVGHQ